MGLRAVFSYGDVVVSGVWEQAYNNAADYNDLWVKGTLTVGSKGQLISLGTTNIKGDVTSLGTIALMNPALFQANYTGTGAELRLPAVAEGGNYNGTDDGGDIPLCIYGVSSGTTTVNTVSADNWQTLQTPKLGDNYITGGKQDDATPAQGVFLLGNADALADGLYLKRVDDPYVSESGDQDFMWQVAKGITVIFDKNGGDTEAEPKAITVECIAGQTEYTPGIPPTPPIRAGYEFTGWNTKADGTGDAYGADTKIDHSMTVYAQWKEIIAKYTVTYDLNGGDANGKDYSPVTVDSGEKVTVKDAPTKSGHVDCPLYADSEEIPTKEPAEGVIENEQSTSISEPSGQETPEAEDGKPEPYAGNSAVFWNPTSGNDSNTGESKEQAVKTLNPYYQRGGQSRGWYIDRNQAGIVYGECWWPGGCKEGRYQLPLSPQCQNVP